jgi:hypothetical protein
MMLVCRAKTSESEKLSLMGYILWYWSVSIANGSRIVFVNYKIALYIVIVIVGSVESVFGSKIIIFNVHEISLDDVTVGQSICTKRKT